MASKHLGSVQIEFGRIELSESILDFLFSNEGDILEFIEKDGELLLRRSTGLPHDDASHTKESLLEEDVETEVEEVIEAAIEDSLDEVGLQPDIRVDEFLETLERRLVPDFLELVQRFSRKKTPSDFSNILEKVMSSLSKTDLSKFTGSLDFRKFFEMFPGAQFQGSGSSKPHTRVYVEDPEEIENDETEIESDIEDDEGTDDSSERRFRITIEDDEEDDQT